MKIKLLMVFILLVFTFNTAKAADWFMYSYYDNAYNICKVYYNTFTWSYWQSCEFSSQRWDSIEGWKHKKNSRGEAYEYDMDSHKYVRTPEDD